ncbi:hypothetical protein PFLuk1_02869 [Pseudomonas fluorescens]|nr:hypothetical protein PFLuk1_02869 [Pseudomonas fluorescens]
MGLGFQGALPNVLQQLLDTHLPMHIGLEHLGVDEETNQALGLAAIAVGNRHADTYFFLAAVAVQQGLERCQQQHEQGHALLLGQSLEPLSEFRRQLECQACAAVALHSRALVIER